jgi:cytoskeletal protein RodZ
MTYEDPNTGRDRNLGQEEAGSSLGSWLAGIVFLAAVLFGGWYFFNQSQKVADVNQPAPSTAANTPSSQPSSGPGVQGSEGGTNGPSAQPAGSSSTGASSGTSGSTTQPASNGADANTTQPAQDSTGVKGAEGGKNGPATDTAPKPQ